MSELCHDGNANIQVGKGCGEECSKEHALDAGKIRFLSPSPIVMA